MARSKHGLPGIYNAAAITLVDQEGAALAVDVNGKLLVSGTLGASTADGSAFVVDTTAGTIAMGVYQATPGTITDGDVAAVLIDVNRRLSTVIRPDAYATDDTTMPATPVMLPVGGEYRLSATTYADGDATVLQTDVNGFLKVTLATLGGGEDLTNNVLGVTQKPLAVSTYSPSLYTEITQVTKANIKAATGNVLSIYCSNTNAALRYFQLHNKATAPAATEVPIYSIPVPAGSATNPGVLILDTTFFTSPGRNFTTGIGWAISTTYGTFTDSATNTEHVALVHYI